MAEPKRRRRVLTPKEREQREKAKRERRMKDAFEKARINGAVRGLVNKYRARLLAPILKKYAKKLERQNKRLWGP